MLVASREDAESLGPAEKRAALEQVLASRTFARSNQLRAFLEFVCEWEIEGRGADLNEYLIGVQVLGRPEGYSPGDDACVRTRAHSLRRKLQDYYQSENPAADIRIDLPKGSYWPQFHRLAPEHPAQEHSAQEQLAEISRERGRPAALPALWWALGALVLVAIIAAALYAGARLAQPRIDPVLREVWGPLLRPEGNVLVCLATPFQLVIRPAPPEAENSLYRPLPDNPEVLNWYLERQTLPPGQRLFMHQGNNSPIFGDVSVLASSIRLLTEAGAKYEILPERIVPPFAMRGRNVLLIGRPEYSPAAALLLDKTWFGIDYHRPANGSAVFYSEAGQRRYFAERNMSFGLITVLPNPAPEGGPFRTILVSGTNSASSHAAAEFLTSAKHLANLAGRFRAEGYPTWPSSWQVVVRARTDKMLPLDVVYQAHRVLAR